MAHFALAWELGGGLGHATRLKPLAEELQRRGHRCTLLLRDLVQTDNVLRDTPWPRLQAPVWLHRAVGVPEVQISLAEILLGCGYLQADHVQALVTGWLSAYALSGVDAVIGDYAPTALLAARVAGLPSASVGIGFYVPPERVPLPPYRDWEPIAPGRAEHAEALVLGNANAVLQRHGRAPLPGLAALFRGDMPLLCTWPELDHYGRGALPDGQPYHERYHGPTFMAHAGTAPQWPEGAGPRVFAYLKAGHPDHAAVLQALDRLGCSTLCYMPEVAAGKPVPVKSPRIHYSMRPVDLGAAFAQSRLAVCHAGEATLVQALLAGVPVLLLPMQAEQFLMSRCVGRTGAGINAGEQRRPIDYGRLIEELLHQPHATRQAQAFAARYAGFTHEAQTRELADAFEALAASGAATKQGAAAP